MPMTKTIWAQKFVTSQSTVVSSAHLEMSEATRSNPSPISIWRARVPLRIRKSQYRTAATMAMSRTSCQRRFVITAAISSHIARFSLDCIRHSHNAHHGLHVVHANDGGPAEDRCRHGGRCSLQSVFNGETQRIAYERFPGRADKKGPVEVRKPPQGAEDLKIMFGGLAEPDSRIQNQAILTDPGPLGSRHPFLEKKDQLIHDGVVSRMDLHGLGGSQHMHQDDRDSLPGRHFSHRRILPEGCDVID